MAALMNSLDKQLGTNGHVEYSWTTSGSKLGTNLTSLKENIVQLSFQLVRGADLQLLSTKFKDILQILNCNIKRDETATEEALSNEALSNEAKEYLTILCKLVAQTRDIIDGKGEYTLSYMLVYELYQVFPEMAEQILSRFFHLTLEETEENELSETGSQPHKQLGARGSQPPIHPYGSWKDVKYFCKYVMDRSDKGNKQIGEFALQIMVDQLRKDAIEVDVTKLSLAAKWCPREKCSRFGKLFVAMSNTYFKHYLDSAITQEQKVKASAKCKMDFRKLLSRMNKDLDTIQIKQCAEEWASIDHSKTTSITGMKQRKALLNLDKNGETRSLESDRVECAINYKQYFENLKKSSKEVKGKRVGLNDFTVEAIKLNALGGDGNELEKDILNSQWRDSSSLTGALGPIIPLVDVSGSMRGDPLHAAIALGIRVAEKSILGKRVLTFSEKGDWHDLSKCTTFTDCVASLQQATWGMTTNFYAAFDNILNAIIISKLTPEQVDGMILAIFSDMQMNVAIDQNNGGKYTEEVFNANRNTDALYKVMEKKYADVGILLWNRPFTPPHILFWNLRQTTGFPVATNQANVTMFSGFSPALLNNFCNKGLEGLKNVDPWSQLVDSLDNPRFHF
jgi:hypothetical protein